MLIRHALPADLPMIEKIYAGARAYMAETGNPTQWGDRYPLSVQVEEVEEDIALGRSFVCEEDGRIAAVFMFTEGPDPTYAVIEGRWPDDGPYGVVHRLAAGVTRKGAGEFCLRWCLEQCGTLRIDTHEDNRPMRALLKKLDFSYCGIIYVEDGTPRRAYYKKWN